jgi:polyphosphate kinase
MEKKTVQIELQARFDEASISYAEQMQVEGIKLIFGIKVKSTCKMCYRKK